MNDATKWMHLPVCLMDADCWCDGTARRTESFTCGAGYSPVTKY
ncbi:hypothetical protein EYZ11_012587 [Aspergillus tanneri]|uniref:Uncharacterized protein n=1 Tax=Aspergillus tanneri TaxID=1220188 RepID=A0A4S3J1Z9_9EURO|nr:hypothetical protein EYZ11_012587 [Aspergillus tanneri]